MPRPNDTAADMVNAGAAETGGGAEAGRADFAGAVRGLAADYVGKRKGDAVGAISDVADAIRTSGNGFDSSPNIKAFFDQAAEGVDELADRIARRSLAELFDEVEAAARRRPVLAGVAVAAAGVALLRFLRDRRNRPLARSRALVPAEPAGSRSQV